MSEFLYLASKLIRDLSIDHKDLFTNPVNIPLRNGKGFDHASKRRKGPFSNIRNGNAVVVKKKNLTKLDKREN